MGRDLQPIDWTTYLTMHRAHREQALACADALLAGEVPADALPGWRIDPATVLMQLTQTPPQVDGVALFAQLAEPDALPTGSGSRLAEQHHRALLKRCTDSLPQTPRNSIAWGVSRLRWLGPRIEHHQRTAWQSPEAESPEKDARTAAMWAAWASGNPWGLREDWESLFLTAATRSFRAVGQARNIPAGAMDQALADLREAFFYRMLMPDSEGVPGWAWLAVRVLEGAGKAPLTTLVGAVSYTHLRAHET